MSIPSSDVLGLSPADALTGSCLLDWYVCKNVKEERATVKSRYRLAQRVSDRPGNAVGQACSPGPAASPGPGCLRQIP